ncbi:unnamed protein product [Pylaiella littoralis]
MPEMRVPFTALAQRYKLHGFDPIEVFSTDDSCGDVEVLREALGPAAARFSPRPLAESGKSVLPLTFPANKTPTVIQPASDDGGISSHAIAQLLQEAKTAT